MHWLKQRFYWNKIRFIQAWKCRINYQSLHLLLSSSAAKDSTHSLSGLSHFCLFTISSVSMFVCTAQLRNLVWVCAFFLYFANVETGAKGISSTVSSHSKTGWNCAEFWTTFTEAICKLLRTKNWGESWSGGMMAKQRGAGLRINKPFNWTTFIKATIDAAQIFVL